MDYTALTKAIEDAQIITIFRHEHPDCDALGSQFGFFHWLKNNYPDKQVYALGNETTDQTVFPQSDTVDEDVIGQSTAFILDTSNRPRIDDQRYAKAAKLVKIDHHPESDAFGDPSYVIPKSAATCEILADYFRSRPECRVTKETAEYLYKGLLTDTLSYSTSNTTQHTLEMGGYLAGFGIDIPAINRDLFDKSEAEFRFAGFLRSHVMMQGSMAYVIVSLEDQKAWNITGPHSRDFVSELGHVREFKAWAIFSEKEEDGKHLYDGSLRSKTATLNDLAAQYNGGGHKNASGVKNLSRQDIEELTRKIAERC